MSEAEDPAEKLLADALKAQARSAPSEPAPLPAPLAPAPGPVPSPSEPSLAADPGPPPPGLFSGSGSMSGPAAAPGPLPGLSGQMPPPPSYGLLSGADASSLERERAALDAEAPTNGVVRVAPVQPPAVRRPLAAYWILLVAVLLGLAAGSIIGLLTLV